MMGAERVSDLTSQQTPHTSHSWASYGVSIVRILEKTDRVIMALHCTKLFFQENAFADVICEMAAILFRP